MYGIVDRPVADLDPASQLLVWAMRTWVETVGRRQCPGLVIGAAFARQNMIASLQPFLRMMAGLNRGGLENFEFCRLACNHVSEHEAILLQLLSEASRDAVLIVRNTLSLLVEEEYVGDLFEAVVRLSGNLRGASKPPQANR